MLKPVDSAIPGGTKIVILAMGGGFFNNSKADMPRAQEQADMKAVVPRIKSRGITIVSELMSTIPTNYKQPDRIHWTAEGHRLFAEQLLPKVISALGGSHAGRP